MKYILIIMFLFISLSSFSQKTIELLSEERPLVEIEINGKKSVMLIDTGSSINIICKSAVKEHKMRLRNLYSGNIYSASNELKARHVDKALIKLGDKYIYQFVMVNIDDLIDSIFQSTGIKISGILGTPAIKQLNMTINLFNNNIIINENNTY